jgi:hypothetical protein
MSAVTPTLVALWIHIPFVTAWIGLVMFDIIALIAPGLTMEQRARMIAWSRPFVLVAIPVILVTGILQTIDNPIKPVESYADLNELKSASVYGYALFWKHGCVMATFALTLVARFWLAPRLLISSTASAGAPAAFSQERMLFWASSLNLAACLAALVFATRMVWALH